MSTTDSPTDPSPSTPKVKAKTERKQPAGVWIACSPDGSGCECVPFSSELAALRHAMSKGLTVVHVAYGTPVTEAVK